MFVKDMPNTTGLISRKDHLSEKDAEVVANLKKAGAILTCLTNTSQLCMWFESSNYLYGTTNNPYNLSRIVGGSSGGEGCIVSSAGSVFGVGSDIGGSIRMV
jgi:fatty acid amide hydrolase 2